MNRRLLSGLFSLAVFCIGIQCSAFATTPELTELIEAKQTFQSLAHSSNPYIAQMAQNNLERLRDLKQNTLTAPSQERIEVPLLTRNNSTLAVPALLNEHVMGTFLVDTGATYTVITPRVARKLGINTHQANRMVKITTANGTIKAPVVTVPSITIGGFQVNNVDVIIQPLGNDILLAGLLGMNFFKDIELTFKKDKLILIREQPLATATHK